jgi:hypothetical protein
MHKSSLPYRVGSSKIEFPVPQQRSLQCGLAAVTIVEVEKRWLKKPASAAAPMPAQFVPGAVVIVTLSNPREKFWGMILALAPEGLSLSGVELASFEDLAVMVKDGEPFSPAVVFFPMHRIERVELDLPDGNLPSLSQRFLAKTGLDPSVTLTPRQSGCDQPVDAALGENPTKEQA